MAVLGLGRHSKSRAKITKPRVTNTKSLVNIKHIFTLSLANTMNSFLATSRSQSPGIV